MWLANVVGAITIVGAMTSLFVTVLAGSATALFASASIPARLIRLFTL